MDMPRDGDRLQHLRAVLPCEVRVISAAHPLSGRLVAARSFKRLNGVLLVVIELPDGSPGTIPAAATDVLGPVEADGPAWWWMRRGGGGCGNWWWCWRAGARRLAGLPVPGRDDANRFTSSLIAPTTSGEVNPCAC
jgi:hypothetical protein